MSANAATGKASKILVIGPPCGRIKDLSTKVKAINDKHGPFEALFCLGDLFRPDNGNNVELDQAEADLLDGTLKLPIPLYFFLSTSPIHPRIRSLIDSHWESNGKESALEIASGLFFCGKAKVIKLPSGLRVAVAGGAWNAAKWSDSLAREGDDVEDLYNPFITPSSVNDLLADPSFHQTEASKPLRQDDEPPQSLAAARAQIASKAEALQQQADQAESSKAAIDLFLTTNWPTGITLFSNTEKLPHATSRMWGAPPIGQLAKACVPRYHFSLAPGSCGLPDEENGQPLGIAGLDGTQEGKTLRQMGVFWEREPYRNDMSTVCHPFNSTTRFVTLARLANADKQRWFMALNLVPAGNVTIKEAKAQISKIAATGTTPSPYFSGGYEVASIDAKRKAAESTADEIDSGPNFRWSGDAGKGKRSKKGGALPNRPDGPLPDGPRRDRQPLAIPIGPQDCWFCLSNPQCAKHLIIAIGTECYIAMPKGQLPPTSDPLSPVPGGGHVLIIPIEHFPSLLGHSDPELARPIAKEMQEWRIAIRKMYASFDAILISWEVCKTVGSRAGHMQSQVVPIPRAMSSGIQGFFRQAAKKWEYEFIEDQSEVKDFLHIDEDNSIRQQRSDYIRLDFDDCTWIMSLKDRRFNLQFPRETLATFLNVPDRADWKRCARSEAIETAETKAFKIAFEGFSKGVGGS